MRSVVQIPPLLWHPLTEVSCSMWGKNMVDACCLQDSVGLLCWLNRQPCVACGTVRSQRCRRCNFSAGALETPSKHRRQPGHQNAAVRRLVRQLPQSSQPVPPGEPLDDSPLPNCPIRDVVLRASPRLGDGTSVMRGLSVRHGLDGKS